MITFLFWFFKIMKIFSSVLCFCFAQQKQQSVNMEMLIDNTIGSLSYYDDCGNDNVKKQQALMSKTMTLRVRSTFLYVFYLLCKTT